MNVFEIFGDREWRHLRSLPTPVRLDVQSLLVLDWHAAALVNRGLKTARHSPSLRDEAAVASAARLFAQRLQEHDLLAGELRVCLLSTCRGRALENVKWNVLAPERVVQVLGALAMVEFRNGDRLEGEIDITRSGYSSYPADAQMQYLVLAANLCGHTEWAAVRFFAKRAFGQIWRELRGGLLALDAPDALDGKSGAITDTRSLFRQLSPARRQLLLGLADGLAAKESEKAAAPQKSVAAQPFDRVAHMHEHPLLYVPYPKLTRLIEQVEPEIQELLQGLSIPDYEMRRIAGVRQGARTDLVEELVQADVRILSYVVVTAVAHLKDGKFGGGPVWHKVTEWFQKRTVSNFGIIALAQVDGTLGDAQMAGSQPDVSLVATIGLKNLDACRRASRRYQEALRSKQQAPWEALFAGTALLRHVLHHPSYGQTLGTGVTRLLERLDPVLSEMTRGELLDWKQQKDLTV